MPVAGQQAQPVRAGRAVRIAYVGGCHLIGYPVGSDLALPARIAERLRAEGIEVESRVLQPVAIHHLRAIDEFLVADSADVVVLQLGNFETSLTTRSLVRLAFGRRGLRSQGAYRARPDGSYDARPDAIFRQTASGRIRSMGKTVLHRVWLGRFVRTSRIASDLDGVARHLMGRGFGRLVLLDPTPCADRLVNGYRRRVAAALPLDPPGYRRAILFGEDGYPAGAFADAIHLSADGQRRLADAVLSAVLPLVDDEAGRGR